MARISSITKWAAKSVLTCADFRTRSISIVILVVSASQEEIADADDSGFHGDNEYDGNPHFTNLPP